jgi:hypothetical protein
MKSATTALRFFLVTALCLLVTGAALAQDSGQRVPCGILITNWDCGPCAPMNAALDAYIPTQGNDVALIRVHCWWPGADDPIFGANEDQSTFLVNNTPSGPDYAPHLWMDNHVDLGFSDADAVPGFEARKNVPSPLLVDIDFDQTHQQTHVNVEILDPLPAGDYRLFVAVTEDGVFAPGSNGEDYHNQAFRWLFPDTGGLPVETILGLQQFVVDTPINSRWVYENCRATAYVQQLDTGEIQNAGTMFVTEGGVVAVESRAWSDVKAMFQ